MVSNCCIKNTQKKNIGLKEKEGTSGSEDRHRRKVIANKADSAHSALFHSTSA